VREYRGNAARANKWIEPEACHRALSGEGKVLLTSENYVAGIFYKVKSTSCMFVYLYALAKAKDLGTLGGRSTKREQGIGNYA